MINPTYLAVRTRSCKLSPIATFRTFLTKAALGAADAKMRVLHSYRDWLRSVSGPPPPSSKLEIAVKRPMGYGKGREMGWDAG